MSMTITDLRSKFPLKFTITKELIAGSNPDDMLDCPGVRSLKAAINAPEMLVKWMWIDGIIFNAEKIREGVLDITTKEGVDFTEISMENLPMEVTFIIQEKPYAEETL